MSLTGFFALGLHVVSVQLESSVCGGGMVQVI